MRNGLPKIPTPSLLSPDRVPICPEIKSEQRGAERSELEDFQTKAQPKVLGKHAEVFPGEE